MIVPKQSPRAGRTPGDADIAIAIMKIEDIHNFAFGSSAASCAWCHRNDRQMDQEEIDLVQMSTGS